MRSESEERQQKQAKMLKERDDIDMQLKHVRAYHTEVLQETHDALASIDANDAMMSLEDALEEAMYDKETYAYRFGTIEGFDALDIDDDGEVNRMEWYSAKDHVAAVNGRDQTWREDEDRGDIDNLYKNQFPSVVLAELQKPKTPKTVITSPDGKEIELSTPSPCSMALDSCDDEW